MIYTSQHQQLSLDLFESSLEGLNQTNRWVILAHTLPWAELERVYNSHLCNMGKGAENKPARMVIGALIIKHKLSLSDEETVTMIQENPYMQYLCGLSEFTDRPIFDPSLFVYIRKRISIEDINEMTTRVLEKERRLKEEARLRKEQEAKNKGEVVPPPPATDPDAAGFVDSEGRMHKGVLKIDATCSDAEVRYPVDVDIIHDGCMVVDRYINKICRIAKIKAPRTCYKDARRVYLKLIKKKKKGGKLAKETISKMLAYLSKDLRLISFLFAQNSEYRELLSKYEKRTLSATFTMYEQQTMMSSLGINKCADRIISIFQPHLRPIVRGKAKAKTEFGSKDGASIYEGYTFVDHLSWDAYNECTDLPLQINLFKERFGHLPATILADKIYMNKENRKLLEELGIRTYCKPLGRPPKEEKSPEEKAKMAKAVGDRNEVESSFGTAKRVYRANNIRAKLPDTADCWTGMCYFVKNVMKFLRELCHVLTEICQILLSWVKFYSPSSLGAWQAA
mgnify:FL=1